MVRALIELDENLNRVLNLIKARYGFRDKSEAINFVVSKYIDDEAEPELRPEFIEKMKKRQLEPTIKITDFKKHFGLN
ncbi:MAG: antitoxin [archaeon]